MKDIILIDGTNLFHRCHWAFSRLTNNEIITGGIYGFLSMLEYYSFRLNTENFIILWDYNNSHSWRKEIYPDYKKSRIIKKDLSSDSNLNFYNSFNILKEIINKIGIPNLEIKGFEADDLLYLFSTRLKAKSIKIISGDKDMLQLANDNLNIKILKPNKGNTYSIYTEKKIEEEYKIPFNNLINYMALVGDKVDDIKGIAGKVGAMKILNKYKSQKDLIESLQPDDKKIFELNLKLIDLKENENYINKLNLKKEIRTTIINKLKLFSNEEDIQKTFDWLNIKKFIAISFFVFRSKENYLKIIKSF